MKQLITILIFFASVPCAAQWKGPIFGNDQIIAFGVHDTSLFISSSSYVGLYTPWGNHLWTEEDGGINFSDGNISSFATLGKYFFANIGTGFTFRSSDNGASWQQRPGGK